MCAVVRPVRLRVLKFCLLQVKYAPRNDLPDVAARVEVDFCNNRAIGA